jgi:hypothetical protein
MGWRLHVRVHQADPMDAAVRELIERVIELSRSHSIWWELVNDDNKGKYEMKISDHEDFFAATAHAHFLSMVVILYQLFDKRPRTKSIRHLLDALEKTHPDEVANVRQRLDPSWPIFKKVFDIRGNVYAHRNESLAPDKVFERAGLKANALGSLIGLTQDIVALLGSLVGIDSQQALIDEFSRRADSAREDLQLVLHALSPNAP